MKLNTARVWLGGIAGGVVWNAWSFFIQTRLGPFYEPLQKQGLLLKQPRYPFFVGQWIVLLFVMSILLAYLYAWSRATAGAGPKTALKIGMIVGFFAGMPEQLCASHLVAGSAHVAARMDARTVDRRDPGNGGRGFPVQRVNRRTFCREAACPVSFPIPRAFLSY